MYLQSAILPFAKSFGEDERSSIYVLSFFAGRLGRERCHKPPGIGSDTAIKRSKTGDPCTSSNSFKHNLLKPSSCRRRLQPRLATSPTRQQRARPNLHPRFRHRCPLPPSKKSSPQLYSSLPSPRSSLPSSKTIKHGHHHRPIPRPG